MRDRYRQMRMRLVMPRLSTFALAVFTSALTVFTSALGDPGTLPSPAAADQESPSFARRSNERGHRVFSHADSARTLGEGREVTVRFVHSAWNLSPDTLRNVEVGIAVPRSDARQTVRAVDFEPSAARIETTPSGQRTAIFELPALAPQEKLDIRATIRVTLRGIEWRITSRDVGTYDEIPKSILQEYLRDGGNYRLETPRLVAAAEEIRVEHGGMLEQIRRIHDYVVDRLTYERDNRWDAADTVLQRGSGSCSEYSYLMIALCRLSGIPARYVGGSWLGSTSARTPHVDRLFHRWVEVYLPRVGWYPIDPTQDDLTANEGNYYPFFGRIPWSYLALVEGAGDQRDSELLGWDYRSGMRWHSPRKLSSGRVFTDRFAHWTAHDDSDRLRRQRGIAATKRAREFLTGN